MFKDVIGGTALTSDIANECFRINGDSYSGSDVSFVATLRALVAPRMKDDESIYLTINRSRCRSGEASYPDVLQSIRDWEYFPSGNIHLHYFDSRTPEDNAAALSICERFAEYAGEDWERVEKITDFFRKSFTVICYINTKIKGVVLFTDRLSTDRMHYLQCSILAFLPWYFNPEDGVSEDEMELIKSLRDKDSKRYLTCIDKIAEKYDFRSVKIKKLLSGFETRYERQECERVRRTLNDFRIRINNLNDQISGVLREKAEQEIKLLGLEEKLRNPGSGEESEIMKFFMINKNMVLDYVDDTVINFVVRGYLDLFDERMAKCAINKESSLIYNPGGDYSHVISYENMKKLMTAIFVDQTLKVRVCAAYSFQINGGVSAMRNYDFSDECNGYMPNPHIDRYQCMGNYSRHVNDLLAKNEYVGAIMQCVASAKSLNFADSVVLSEFIKSIYGGGTYGHKNRCIELPDGSVVTPTEAVLWINSQEGANNE